MQSFTYSLGKNDISFLNVSAEQTISIYSEAKEYLMFSRYTSKTCYKLQGMYTFTQLLLSDNWFAVRRKPRIDKPTMFCYYLLEMQISCLAAYLTFTQEQLASKRLTNPAEALTPDHALQLGTWKNSANRQETVRYLLLDSTETWTQLLTNTVNWWSNLQGAEQGQADPDLLNAKKKNPLEICLFDNMILNKIQNWNKKENKLEKEKENTTNTNITLEICLGLKASTTEAKKLPRISCEG